MAVDACSGHLSGDTEPNGAPPDHRSNHSIEVKTKMPLNAPPPPITSSNTNLSPSYRIQLPQSRVSRKQGPLTINHHDKPSSISSASPLNLEGPPWTPITTCHIIPPEMQKPTGVLIPPVMQKPSK
ncbi:hypothetical protein Nepgr_015726 [Nepenthes gracilis]|uniref:Uncharacterized protein n=1 Tax=Nepenthes gracilis TaxID=150966 RepID=A0AAD3SNC8_NEPGR|nr:hypothetical protein Nepgr_015726 [Nepenthes gracilis]